MFKITSAANDKLKNYRKLSSSSKARAEQGLFVAEGVRIAADAAESGALQTLFVTEKCIEKYGSELSSVLENAGGSAFIISEQAAEGLSDTRTPQGIFIQCKIPRKLPPEELITEKGRYIVLSGLQDPGNMGTVIRTADALGIDGLFICGCCDVYNPKTVRSAMGSLLHIKFSVTDEDTLFAAFAEKSTKTYAAVLSGYDTYLTEIDFSGNSAVFIGNEGRGLSHETAIRCDVRMTVPMKGRANSLNAAAAAGIIMWELAK